MLIFISVLLLVTTQMGSAQSKVGVSMKRDKALARTYNVVYVPPAGSVFAKPAFDDTVFCAAVVNTMHGVHDMVRPMTRVDSALYTTTIKFPDSTYSVMLDVCLPTEQLPDGFEYIFVRPDSGSYWPGTAIDLMMHADSALNFERRTYPWNYFAYYQHWQETQPDRRTRRVDRTDELDYAKLWALIRKLSILSDASFNRYFTIASLCKEASDGDSLCLVYLDSATNTHLQGRQNEYLLNSQMVWINFLSCHDVAAAGCPVNMRALATMQGLAAQHPRSAFGKAWLDNSWDVEGLEAASVRQVIEAWTHTNDVDVLNAIAHHYITPNSPVYDPILSERYLRRAETSHIQQLGFRSGENHFGSMSGLDDIRSRIVRALSLQNRHADAIVFGEQAMRSARDIDGKHVISDALVQAAIASGDSTRSGRFKQYALPDVPDFEYETIDGTKGRLSDLRGKVVVMDFWFVGCSGCAIEHHSLNEFGKLYSRSANVKFLSIASTDKTIVQRYLQRSPLEATVVADAKRIMDKLGITSAPTHVIIDQFGKTRLWEAGGSSASGEKLANEVEKLLK